MAQLKDTTIQGSARITDTLYTTKINLSGVTASLPLFVDNNKNIITQSASNAWGALGGGASGKHADSYFVKAINSTDNYVPRFDGANGQLKTSKLLIGDTGTLKSYNSSYWTLDWQIYHPGASSQVGALLFNSGDATNITSGQLTWRQYSPQSTAANTTTGFFEAYTLPTVTKGLTANQTYSILTSKNTVTIAQGGTGIAETNPHKVLIGSTSTDTTSVAAPTWRILEASDIPDISDTYATNTVVNGLLALADAMVFKGVLSGAATSENSGAGTLTPTADRGWTYKVDTDGYINGLPVEIGDILICTTDNTPDATTDGENKFDTDNIRNKWVIIQNNVDGAIFRSTNSFTDGQYIVADGANGKVKSQALPVASTDTAGIIKIGTDATNAMAGNTTITHVNQSTTTTSSWRKVILSGGDVYTAQNTAVSNRTNVVYQAVGISAQPSTGTLAATIFQVDTTSTKLYNNYLTFNSGGGWYMSDTTWIRTYGSKSVYMNTGTFRCDGIIQTRTLQHVNAGINVDGDWITGVRGTAPTATTIDGTTTYSDAVIGTSILTLGNNKIGANSASGVAENAKGYLRIYGASSGYGELTYNDAMFQSNKSIYLSANSDSGIANELRGKCGTNDYWRVAGGATASNNGYMEIATADDSNEPIYARQYSGTFKTIIRTATLLDASGNTTFPGTVTATTFYGALSGNATTATSWANARKVYVALGTASKDQTINGDASSNAAAIGIGVDGQLSIANGGTGESSALAAATALGAPYLLSLGTAITASSNLDSGYKAMGTYYSENSTRTNTLAGTVIPMQSGFKMITTVGYRTATIRQFLGAATNNLYYRSSQDTGATWTKWYQFVFLPSGSDNKTFSAIGGTNAPVYVNANGEIVACTTYANATVGKATADANGNTITSYYCTLSTEQILSGAKTFSNILKITNSTASGGTSTGALVVTGGIATGAASYLTGPVHIIGVVGSNKSLIARGIQGCNAGSGNTGTVSGNASDLTNYTDIDWGLYLNYLGGPVHIGSTSDNDLNANTNNFLKLHYTKDSSSTSNGALVVYGGVGIAKKLYVGEKTTTDTLTITNTTQTSHLTLSTNGDNFITMPNNAAAKVAIAVNTNLGTEANSKLVICQTGVVRPGSTNTQTLGDSSYRWQKVYIGTADTYGSGSIPIYWNAGVPSAVSNIELVATDTTTKTVKVANSQGIIKLYAASSGNHGLHNDTTWIIHQNAAKTNTYIYDWKNKGNSDTPIYFDNNGEPAPASVVRMIGWSFDNGSTGTTLSHTSFTTDTIVITIVVSSGENYLTAPITWTSASGSIILNTTTATTGAVTGYIIVAQGNDLTGSNTVTSNSITPTSQSVSYPLANGQEF